MGATVPTMKLPTVYSARSKISRSLHGARRWLREIESARARRNLFGRVGGRLARSESSIGFGDEVSGHLPVAQARGPVELVRVPHLVPGAPDPSRQCTAPWRRGD